SCFSCLLSGDHRALRSFPTRRSSDLIELKAEEAGVTPKEFVDKVSGEIKNIWDLMNTSYDKFIRTTDEDHEKQVKKIFKKMYARSEEHTSELQSRFDLVCRLLLEKKT